MIELAQQLLIGISNGMTYVALALGLTLIFGILHVINFAHGEFFMLGALVSFLMTLNLGVSYEVSIIMAMAGSIVAGYFVHKLAIAPMLIRKNGADDTLLSTYAVSLFVAEGVITLFGPTPKMVTGLSGTFDFYGLSITNQRLFMLLISLGMVLGVYMLLRYSRFGKSLRALAQDKFAAAVVGINVKKVSTATVLLCALLAGTSGALMVPIVSFTPHMGQHILIKLFVIIVIGGMGSVRGTLVVGLALGIIEAFLSQYLNSTSMAIAIYICLLSFLLFKPKGLFSE